MSAFAEGLAPDHLRRGTVFAFDDVFKHLFAEMVTLRVTICTKPSNHFRLTDAFEIIRAEVRTCRIFAVFAALNPLKLQRRRSYFSPNLRAITLRLYKKPASGAR
jgi:hypothetical protein